MTPFDQFKNFYKLEWPHVLTQYLNHHYVYVSPTAIGLVKPEDDAWWIEYVAGDVEELICHLPFWLPFLNYNDKGRFRCHATARVINLLLKHDSFKDGNPDALPWRGRECAKGEATQAAIANHGG